MSLFKFLHIQYLSTKNIIPLIFKSEEFKLFIPFLKPYKSTANKTYKRRKKLPDGRRWAETVESDLKKFEDLGLGNEYFDEIRKLLKIK